ncbi:MAG: hypothetical protein CMF23_10890 [Ignavibacteriae bacterium]|nr:hypothetical protein [Ignavibacteriota bacterium]
MFLLGFSAVITAQSLSFKYFSSDDGLAQNSVYSMIQDSKGYIWIGTEGGLSKFDGLKFTNYTKLNGLPDNHIRVVFEDHQKNIWIGTNKGVAKYSNNKFEPKFTEILGSSIVYSFNSTIDSNIFAATSNGVFIIDTKNKACTGIVDTNNNAQYRDIVNYLGTTYFASDRGIFERNSNGSLDQIQLNTISDTIYTLFTDSNNNLWIGTEKGVDVVNYSNDEYEIIKTYPFGKIFEITEDINNNIWISTFENGVFKVIKKEIKQYNSSNGLSSNDITSILIDARGDLWFGTLYGGICKLAVEQFEVFSSQNGLTNDIVFSISQDKYNNMWFGHVGDGISIYNTGMFKNITTKEGLVDNNVASIYKSKNDNLWIGSQGGVTKYDYSNYTTFTTQNGLVDSWVLSIHEDYKGNMWFGTRAGVSKYDGQKIISFSSAEGFPKDWVWDIFEDNQNRLWFATDDSGLVLLEGNNFRRLTKENGLPLNDVFSITQDRYDNYWIATDGGGLVKYDGKSFQTITIEDGLPSNTCYFLFEEGPYLYIGTTKGIARFEYSAFDEKGKSAFKVYSKKDGLISSEMNTGSYFRDKERNLWFGTEKGVVKFSPYLKPNLIPSPIYIHNIRIIDGKSEIDTTVNSELNLEYDQNSIRFDYIGISFASPENMIYSYILDGSDQKWTETIEHSITYRSLSPGSYTFKVRCRNSDGIWSESADLIIIISPPFWQTWWFLSVVSILILSSIYSFYLLKTNQVKRRNIELANMVRLRTRELETEKNKSDELLLNILPVSLVRELKEKGSVQPREFKNVTILFTDFKEFTYTASVLPAEELVKELNEIFLGFDNIIEQNGLEKLKTIGDSYMAAGGLPQEAEDHAIKVVNAAIEMQELIKERNKNSAIKWDMRAGIHSGNVIAGVVGTKKFTYDIWGDTVNIASRMESSGEANQINISAYTYMLVKDYYDCEYRGKVDAKGKGKIDMYFIKERKNNI